MTDHWKGSTAVFALGMAGGLVTMSCLLTTGDGQFFFSLPVTKVLIALTLIAMACGRAFSKCPVTGHSCNFRKCSA